MDHIVTFIVCGVFGAVATFLLQKAGCSAVVASCVTGLVGAGMGALMGSTHIPLIIFAGSFVGMTSPDVGNLSIMILGGTVAAVIYRYTLTYFVGFGGKLGTIAFISVIAAVTVVKWVESFTGRTGSAK